ncbi:AAA family ATPase [Microbacterium sp. NPDC019599]|uniref:helix-turn-helix transcriptional regulator n=1 Tax=Microbacterium sp. NPDC019599 TaxID=3154690 RepID=UPI0033C124CC
MAAGGALADGVLFGRGPELELLDDLLARASAGEAQAILVSGLVGVGKTSLARRAAQQRTDATLLFGACLPLVSIAVPLLGVRSVLRSAPPELDAPEVPEDAPTGDVLVRIDDWLTRLCAEGSVALVLDDLQWADQGTLDILTFLIAGPVGRRLAIVATIRTEEVAEAHRLQRWLADIRRLPRVTEVELGPLDHEATGRQIAALLGAEPHTTLVDDVHGHSGGNPYLNRLIVQGLSPTARRIDLELPRDLRAAVLSAWRQLSTTAREATSALAVAGAPLSPADLGRAASIEGAESAMTEAADAGIVERRPGGAVWFRHPLTPEVLEEALPAERSRVLHAAFATFLEARGPGSELPTMTAVARHRSRGDSPSAALASALRAADAAERSGAWRDAAQMLALADEVVAPDDAQRLMMLRRRIRAAAEAGLLAEELDVVERLIAILEEPGSTADPAELGRLMVRRIHLRASNGKSFFLLEDAQQALAVAEKAPGSSAHAFALAEAAQTGTWHEDPEAVRHAHEALRLARRLDDDRTLSYALTASAMQWIVAKGGVPALALASEAADAARRARDWWAFFHATLWEGNAQETWSSETFALSLAMRRLQMQEDGAPHVYIATIAADEAMSWFCVGRPEITAARLREAFAADPGPFGDVHARLTAARFATWQGRQAEAEAHLARADELLGTSGEFAAFELDAVRAEVRLGAGDALGALEAARRGIDTEGLAPTMCEWLLPLAARAIADRIVLTRDAGQDDSPLLEELAVLVAEHPDIIRDFGQSEPILELQMTAMAALYVAEVARGTAAPDEGELWIAAADALVDGQLPWEESYARRHAAEALLVHDADRVRGADQLRRGLELADRLGAAPIAADLRALARRARIALAKPTQVDGDRLAAVVSVTPRERDILSLVIAGRTYGEIARELFISEKTVSTHISHLLDKTGTANRLELAGFIERAMTTQDA